MTLTTDVVGRAPIVGQRRLYPDPGPAEQQALIAALAGPWGRGSTTIADAERAFAVAHALSPGHAPTFVTNGTHAIVMALEALGIGVGDHVLVPALTWQATAGAVLDVNATPVLIDVSREHWTIDVDLVEAHIEECLAASRPLPAAIIAVHLYQRAADVLRLLALCQENGIWLIEDAAHAHGATYCGEPLGTFGAIGTFSLESTKPLSCGEGGILVTGVPLLEQRIRSQRDCGRLEAATIAAGADVPRATLAWRARVEATPGLASSTLQSGPYRPTAVTAALLAVQAERFPAEAERRAAGLQACNAALAGFDGLTIPAAQPELTSPVLFKFGFTLDLGAWAPLRPERFREVLAFLLGGYLVDAPYEPLSADASGAPSALYRPASKRRHHLSAEYLAAVDPARYYAPVASGIHASGVMIEGPFLGEVGAADLLLDALTWIRTHAGKLAELRLP